MADATAFDWLCAQLEERTSLDRLEARGTVRLALKEAGLDAKGVTASQMGVVLAKVLPAELDARGVSGSADVCRALASALAEDSKGWDSQHGAESPEEVFKRLAAG